MSLQDRCWRQARAPRGLVKRHRTCQGVGRHGAVQVDVEKVLTDRQVVRCPPVRIYGAENVRWKGGGRHGDVLPMRQLVRGLDQV